MNEAAPKKMWLNAIIFAVILGVTAYVVLNGLQLDTVSQNLSSINPFYLSVAILCGFLFVIFESVNIRRILNSLGYRVNPVNGLKYGAAGFFFSSLTPSASGGQPMQLYFMHRDKIKLSHGSMTLLIEFACFQLVSTCLGTIGFIINKDIILSAGKYFWVLLVCGLLVNLIILLVILMIIFFPKPASALVKGISRVLRKFRFFRRRINDDNINDFLLEYHESADFLKKNPPLLIKLVLTGIAQILSLYSVVFFVCLALGLTDFSWISITSLQGTFSVGVSFIPLPGAMGVSEYGFSVVYGAVFSEKFIGTILILSRAVSFYLPLVLSGVYLGLTILIDRLKNRGRM